MRHFRIGSTTFLGVRILSNTDSLRYLISVESLPPNRTPGTPPPPRRRMPRAFDFPDAIPRTTIPRAMCWQSRAADDKAASIASTPHGSRYRKTAAGTTTRQSHPNPETSSRFLGETPANFSHTCIYRDLARFTKSSRRI
jgi:hypothetical protein